MTAPKISMPRRGLIRYEDDAALVEFQAEVLRDGILLHRNGVKVLRGAPQDIGPIKRAIETWFCQKFIDAEMDRS